jgi:S-DNA-T family DNA segregation ATPase FtsK/SpoIIIE
MSSLLRKVVPGRKAGDTPPTFALSIFDPIFLGIDDFGATVTIELAYRNLLAGGEPGSGKSVLLNNIVGHASLCTDVQLVLIDGKEVELGMWEDVADVFVGRSEVEATRILRLLQAEMNRRYDWLKARRRRKVERGDGISFILVVIDELAWFSATVGDKHSQEEFVRLVRDLVARGRAAGIIVVAATQRPSADIVPTNLRDIFSYRCAFRCTTEASSDIILGTGWAKKGYDATTIPPESRGVGWLLAEGGYPRRFKGAYLSDDEIDELVNRAAVIRHSRGRGAA